MVQRWLQVNRRKWNCNGLDSSEAAEAMLYVGSGATQDVYPLHLGNLDPIETAEGVGGGFSVSDTARRILKKRCGFPAKHGCR
jgi:hypothetical protein